MEGVHIGDSPLYIMLAMPLYIMLAIMVAVAAIVSTDLRDGGGKPRPRRVVNLVALMVVIGSWAGVSHILILIFALNSYESMTKLQVLHAAMQMVVLIMVPILSVTWYRAVALHVVPAEELPPPPPARLPSPPQGQSAPAAPGPAGAAD